jgi:uncharacterized membrane protein
MSCVRGCPCPETYSVRALGRPAPALAKEAFMAKLVAIAYRDDPDCAAKAAGDLTNLPFAVTADLDDAVAVVVNRHGDAKLLQSTNLTTLGALDGALIGLVSGVVLTLGFPFLGGLAVAGAAIGATAIGALTGGAVGHYTDIGIDHEFVRKIAESLPPNSSALFVLVEGDNTDDILKQLATCGGELLVTDLPDDQAAKLRDALKREHEEEGSLATDKRKPRY